MNDESTLHPDVFISHASEDKDSFARPLALTLRSLGASVWYDEFSLRVGDSLSGSIDKGIAAARYGLIVISPAFIEKRWPEYELRGFISREIQEGKVILPIWHKVSRSDVMKFSPTLADKVAILTEMREASDIAIQVLREIRPDLYERHPRAVLEKLVNGEALKSLQIEVGYLRYKLKDLQCPHCDAPVAEKISAPIDEGGKHWDLREIFECGFTRFAGDIECFCPSDSEAPPISEFDIVTWCINGRWFGNAIPKTRRVHRISPVRALASSQLDAEQQLIKRLSHLGIRC